MKNKIRLIGVISLAVLLVFSIAACKSAEEKAKSDLEGTWTATIENVPVTIKFTGTNFEMTPYPGESGIAKATGTYTVGSGLIAFAFNEPAELKNYPQAFKYTLNGNSLVITFGEGADGKPANYTFTKKQ
jgi:hypothetical protein